MANPDTSPAPGSMGALSAPISNGRLIRWIIGLGLRHPWRCASLLGVNLLLLGLGLAGITFTGTAFDIMRHAVDPVNVPAPEWHGRRLPEAWLAEPYKLVVGIAVMIVVWAAMRGALRIYAATSQARLVQSVLSYLRSGVYDKLQRLSFRFFDANQTGTIIARATGDVSSIATFSEWALIQSVMLVATLTVNLIYMLSIHPLLTVVCLGTTPFLLFASVRFSRKVRPAYEENRRRYDELIMTLAENIQGHHVVKGFAREDAEIAKFAARNAAVREQQRWLFRRASAYTFVMHSLTQLNLVLVLAVGGYLVIVHPGEDTPSITVGKLIIFAALLQQFSAQVASMSEVANSLQASLTAAHRVYEVLQAPLEIASKPTAIRCQRLAGRVQFEKVSFAYHAREPVLRDLEFDVQPGMCVAILGPTGAGKSTLLSLIPRFYDPASGIVRIDDVDVRDYDLNDLRRNIGLVFQESFLFSNSVANNIAFGHPAASRAQVEKAAEIACAAEFIKQLPKGYDTVTGEYGATLSGGQRQRLAIARAILLEPPILILDDATSAVDPETEHEILDAMDRAMEGRTTFIIAHRLSTLRRADLVLVLEQGRIVERGTHAELMKNDGFYGQMARRQQADLESRLILQALRWDRGEVSSPLLDEDHLP